MSANFTPNNRVYGSIGSFKHWVQKTLPLVYDDSLSYYETLCKMTHYLNEVIEQTEAMGGHVTELHTAYGELQKYVNEFISNISIENEVNRKLDKMAVDGTLSSLIDPIVYQYKYELSKQNKDERHRIESILKSYVADINVLSSRIDSFLSLPFGSTSGDAELDDIRTTAYGVKEDSAGNAVRKQYKRLNDTKCDKVIYNMLQGGMITESTSVGSEVVENSSDGITFESITTYGAYYKRILNTYGTITKLLMVVDFEAIEDSVFPFNVGASCYCFNKGLQLDNIVGESTLKVHSKGNYRLKSIINIDESEAQNCTDLMVSPLLKTKGAKIRVRDYVLLDVTNISDEVINAIDFDNYMEDGYFTQHKNVGLSAYAGYAVNSKNSEKSKYAEYASLGGIVIDELPVIEDKIVHGFSGAIVDTIGGYIRVSAVNTTYGSAYMDYTLEKGVRYLAVWVGERFTHLSLINKTGDGWLNSAVNSVEVDGEIYHYATITAEEGYQLNALYWNSVSNKNTMFKPVVITAIPSSAVVTPRYIKFIVTNDVVDLVSMSLANNSSWDGKKVLFIGDSLTEANVYQKRVKELLGVETYNLALGGAGIGNLSAMLNASHVENMDLIVLYAGYNNRGMADGVVGDKGVDTIAGLMQNTIDRIYACLSTVGNLTCKVMVVTVDCAGKYNYIDADGYEEYPKGSGRTMETMANIQKAVAQANGLPCCDLWHNSGINKYTWNVFGVDSEATNDEYAKYRLNSTGEIVSTDPIKYETGRQYVQKVNGNYVLTEYTGTVPYPFNNDQLHKSTAGYNRIGECIVGTIISAFGR